MNEKHTKGPWKVLDFRTSDNLTAYLLENTMGAEYGEEQAANTRLISAAPELLEALISALPAIEEGEQFEKPNGKKLSTTVRALIRRVSPEAGA